MRIHARAYAGPDDQPTMAALAHTHPAENLHRVDLPYRFSSWALDEPENARLWFDDAGRLVAWAALQTPFWALDYAFDPALPELHAAVLTWLDGRARAVLDTPYGHPAWYVNVFAGQAARRRDLEAAGFASQADVGEDSWSKVLMQRVGSALESDSLPDGLTIRPLAGAAEVAAYVELHRHAFESKSMTEGWRARTLTHPAYQPDLDLVAVAPDGRLAAFCISWFNATGLGSPSGQIEPLGVHADFRQFGLGRAILTEALRRLSKRGAAQVFVETDSYRNAAFRLYESAGFRVIQDVQVYRKDYATPQSGA